MSERLSARTIFQALEPSLGLSWIGGAENPDRIIWEPRISGVSLCGLWDLIHPHRIQILGEEEFHFLDSLAPPVRAALDRRLLSPESGAVLVCGDRSRAEALRPAADATGTPLWRSPYPAGEALELLSQHQRSLDAVFTLLHGVFMEILGLGVLLSGSHGAGKSELALELISRGHRLVADDAPKFTRVAPNVIEGVCPETLHDFLEVRGLGILNVRRMFGNSAIKRNKRLRLIVNLVRLEEAAFPPETRLGGARTTLKILDVLIPQISVPIAPGRNLAVLVECAVRDHVMRLAGYHAEQDLTARLTRAMERESPCE